MLIYNLVVRCYGWLIHLAAFRNTKARHWVEGRKNWREKYLEKLNPLQSSGKIWVHCASYGEFEQGRPLMEALRVKFPDKKIILTFFSPSGYEVFKNWSGADVVMYLPLDTPGNAHDFINMIKPETAIFVKYEFWLNYLHELKSNRINTILVSAVFKPHHPFFRWYGGIFRSSLSAFTSIFVQDENSSILLKKIGIKHAQVSGDTRFDRVTDIRKSFQPIAFFEQYCKGKQFLIAGSTWPGDERFLINSIKEIQELGLKLILVPHEIGESSIQKLLQELNSRQISSVRYSSGIPDPNADVLIVDAIGVLSRIYHYAEITYVGGGFEDGIHNTLEPAVFNKPVLFAGKTHHKYNEALELIDIGVAVNVNTKEELLQAIEHYMNDPYKNMFRAKSENYFRSKTGTTEKVLKTLSGN